MATQPFITALSRLVDGRASLDERALVGRQLVDELGLPSEAAENLLNDDLCVNEARFLLALLGPDDSLGVSLHREISSEAGRFEAKFSGALPVAEAVTSEAGSVDVAVAVADALSHPSLPIAEAIRAESGVVDIAESVVAEIGGANLDLSGELLAEAGEIDISAGVMAEVLSLSLGTTVEEPKPANTLWRVALPLMAVAAAVLFVFFGPGAEEPVGHSLTQFASFDEVKVDSLDYGEDTMVQVFQSEDGPLIIWIDDEVVL